MSDFAKDDENEATIGFRKSSREIPTAPPVFLRRCRLKRASENLTTGHVNKETAMSDHSSKGRALVTALQDEQVPADRLAERGYDLIVVAGMKHGYKTRRPSGEPNRTVGHAAASRPRR